MNPAFWLERAARTWPQSPALLLGTEVQADYRTFAARAAGLGRALREDFGVQPGDRVALFSPNHLAYLIALYGAWYAGAAVVPINAKLHPKEAAWIISDARARVVLTDGQGCEALPSLLVEDGATVLDLTSGAFEALTHQPPLPSPHPLTAEDLVWLFYTSGTTGKPKGVMMVARNLLAMTWSYFVDVDPVESEDAILYAAPMSHGAGLYNFMHVLRGARHVVPVSGGFDPAEILDLAVQLRRVSFFAAPTVVSRLVAVAKASGQSEGLAGDGIKTIVYGGGPMYVADIQEAVSVMGPRFVQIYGQGECPMAITALSRAAVADRSHPRWRPRLGSVGTAQSGVEIRVVDGDGVALPAGEVGEITVRGLGVMAGYWQNPQATAQTLRDGWLWTGDMGVLDGDGFLTLHDRSKDVIISGGTNIYPREVEEALLTHPSVAEVSVIGRPHPDWGEEVVAVVVARGDAVIDPASLDAHCLAQIARFKRPKAYVVREALPKNNYGKVLKTVLRAELTVETGPSNG